MSKAAGSDGLLYSAALAGLASAIGAGQHKQKYPELPLILEMYLPSSARGPLGEARHADGEQKSSGSDLRFRVPGAQWTEVVGYWGRNDKVTGVELSAASDMQLSVAILRCRRP